MLEVMKAKKIMDETTNRYEYNRVRKRYLDHVGDISCSWCRYHLGDNLDHKLYGDYGARGKVRYPNWKLVTKKKKQWMDKELKYKTRNNWGHISTKIIF